MICSLLPVGTAGFCKVCCQAIIHRKEILVIPVKCSWKIKKKVYNLAKERLLKLFDEIIRCTIWCNCTVCQCNFSLNVQICQLWILATCQRLIRVTHWSTRVPSDSVKYLRNCRSIYQSCVRSRSEKCIKLSGKLNQHHFNSALEIMVSARDHWLAFTRVGKLHLFLKRNCMRLDTHFLERMPTRWKRKRRV